MLSKFEIRQIFKKLSKSDAAQLPYTKGHQ